VAFVAAPAGGVAPVISRVPLENDHVCGDGALVTRFHEQFRAFQLARVSSRIPLSTISTTIGFREME